MLGVHLNVPLSDKGAINLAYLWLDGNQVINNGSSTLEPWNRVVVYGGDFDYRLGSKLGLYGGYAKSDLFYNAESKMDEDNSAWWLGLNYGGKEDKWGIGAGYRSIDPLYAAPGAWGRIGTMWNPVDLEGFNANAWFTINDRLSLSAKAAFLRGRDTDASNLTEDDKVTTFHIGADYKLSDMSSFMLSYETANWDFDGGASPMQSWWTLGFNFGLSSNTNLRVFWQMSDTDSDGASQFNFFGSERARGGLIGTQLSVKF
jgi:predicted porin